MSLEMSLKPWKALKRETYVHSPYRSLEDVLFELPVGRHATLTSRRVAAGSRT